MIPEPLLAEFDRTLRSGGYNLLLGAGTSLDSVNGSGDPLPSGEELRKQLCMVVGAGANTSLTRVSRLLTPQQVEQELALRFSNCVPGRSLRHLSRYIWKRAFTFNIDDVLEAHYRIAGKAAKQALVPLNFDSPFEPSPERAELHAVHLHGSVLFPESGFVFSAAEYARIMRDLNSWMHLLSGILATEPFIIAGASLDEMDLEYYLSHRTDSTPRRGRGPSLLIEPYPNRVTESDCKRFGLQLVQATFGEFLEWLHKRIPAPPSIADLIVPDSLAIFGDGVEKRDLLRFFSDFEQVPAGDRNLPPAPSAFLYGRAPKWTELDEHLDVEREDNGHVSDVVSRAWEAPEAKFVILLDEPGTGKSTTIRRVAHNFSGSGQAVFSVTTQARIDTDSAIRCLITARSKVLLIVDGLADHVDQIEEIISDPRVAHHVAVLASERSYRSEYIDLVLAGRERTTVDLTPMDVNELQQLIERYRHFGLVAEPSAIANPKRFASQLEGEPVAISICRIINDFRPFDNICESLWNAAHEDQRLAFMCTSLVHRCHRVGLRYSILQSILGPTFAVSNIVGADVPLKLALNENDDDFVVPANPVIAERLLGTVAQRDTLALATVFEKLARAVAPYVNRKAIMRRSPEARLAGRLFDADAIVRPLLGPRAESFYSAVQKEWEWNSRYWEQRALLAAETDLQTGLRHARQAVAIERHPFPLTTLGSLLLRSMEANPGERDSAFADAMARLIDAIEIEVRRNRTSVHPFATLLNGAARFLQLGGQLTAEQDEAIDRYAEEAERRFATDPLVASSLRRLYESDE